MKKITAGVLAFSLIALLGVSLVAAFPFGFGKGINADLTEEEQLEAQVFHDELRKAIETKDFEAWKTLIQSQLTEANFNSFVERHENMEYNQGENQQLREQLREARQSGDYETAEQLRQQMGKNTMGFEKGKHSQMKGSGCTLNSN